MRAIKFRAWDYDTQRMIFETDIVFHDGTAYASQRDYRDCISIDMELMQFTGLKDKNGIEIYEGDIIDLNLNDIRKGTVIFSKGCFIIKVDKSNYFDLDYATDVGIVVGNIYETKD